MGQSLEILKKEALKYAGEAFEEHKEQIFEALQIMCQCSYLARHSGLLALEEVVDLWEEEISPAGGGGVASDQYGDEACMLSIAERDMPLTELLIFSIRKIVDGNGVWRDEYKEEILKEAAKNGYSGYEWYVVLIYLTGARDILEGIYPERFDFNFRVMIPERWLEDYDCHCQEWMENLQKEEQERKEESLRNSFQREHSVKTAFHRRFGEMEPEKLQHILKELDDKTLAAGTAFAEEPVRNRFLENMGKRQKEFVMEEWRSRDYSYHLEDILVAMDRILIVAGLL